MIWVILVTACISDKCRVFLHEQNFPNEKRCEVAVTEANKSNWSKAMTREIKCVRAK